MMAPAERAPGAALVEAAIEGLDLGRWFAAVVVGSHLVNGGPPGRRRLLEAAARHVEAGGAVLIEAYPPELDWAAQVGRTHALGEVRSTLTMALVDGPRLLASVRYEAGEACWHQAFEAELLDEASIRAELERAGLAFGAWLDRRRGWLMARPAPSAS